MVMRLENKEVYVNYMIQFVEVELKTEMQWKNYG